MSTCPECTNVSLIVRNPSIAVFWVEIRRLHFHIYKSISTVSNVITKFGGEF